jgi:hypothetical protein
VGGRAPAPSAPSGSAPPETGTAGIAVTPGADLLVRVDSPPGSGGHLEVRWVDGSTVSVRVEAGAATFTTGADLLVVEVLDPGATVVFDMPRDAPRVEMRIGDRRVFLQEGSRVIPAPGEGEREGEGGTWRIPLAP